MATSPPSQFAALLRRSKFASFDPHIGQVYTTFDGHAARGHFGLKRPLAVRRRNAHITVQAVDSREQQTVWRSAERENRWIRMWDELGVSPRANSSSSWLSRLGARVNEVHWLVDSEFAPREKSALEQAREAEEHEIAKGQLAKGVTFRAPRSWAIPNVEAMSELEFEKYLARLRKLRPAFKRYMGDKYENTNWKGASLFLHSHIDNSDFLDFLEHHQYKEYHTRRPRQIEQQPHRFAGLSYHHNPPLQVLATHKPVIGRVVADRINRVQSKAGRPTTTNDSVVVAAGMTATLAQGARDSEQRQVSEFRVERAAMAHVPRTVAPEPEGLERTLFFPHVFEASRGAGVGVERAYRPGSRQYVGQPPVFLPDMMKAVKLPATKVVENWTPQQGGEASGQKLLDSLMSFGAR